SSARTPQGWRYMLGLGAAPAIAMCAGMSQLPESPRWLAARALAVGDTEARGALAVLRLLRDNGTGREGKRAGTSAGTDTATGAIDGGGDDDVERELDDIRADLAAAAVAGADRAVGLGAALSDPRVRAALVLGCVLQLAQQLTGLNTLMYYSATILQVSQTTEAEPDPFAESSERAVCLSAATATAQMVGNFIGMALVERSGRRTLTLWSLGAVSASLVLLGFAFHGTGSTALAVASMIAYLLAFGIGLAPMPWTVNAEIYPIRVRSLCVSIATGVNWAANFLVSLTFLSLGEALSSDREDAKHHPDGVFWLFSGIGVACWCWLYRRMPETKGLSLEAIGQLFEPAQNSGRSGVCRCWC
ncbi:MAG: MFS transporter, partial [Pseudomonadota bacterium]|nr:MFS transporter [Pseudomonadota bacterium]